MYLIATGSYCQVTITSSEKLLYAAESLDTDERNHPQKGISDLCIVLYVTTYV